MNKARILRVIDKLEIGGAQTSIQDLVTNKDLMKKFDFYVCALRRTLNEVDIKANNIIKLNRKKYDPLSILDILRIAKKYEIDILHLHLKKSIIIGIIASFFGRWKVVVHQHSVRMNFFYKNFLKITKNRVDIFIAVSEYIKNDLIERAKITPSKIRIISNYIDLRKFKPDINRSEIRIQLGIKKEEMVLGFIGRLEEEKGCKYLIEAVKNLHLTDRSLVLMIIGEGKIKKNIIKLSRNLGSKKRPLILGVQKDIPNLLAAFDIAIIPSLLEPFGKVALEYMAMRVPIIASKVGGLAELIKHEENGLCVESGSIRELTNAIDRLIIDEKLRKKLSDNGFRYVKKFDIKMILPQLKDLYDELLMTK